jgi:hypothetical protein
MRNLQYPAEDVLYANNTSGFSGLFRQCERGETEHLGEMGAGLAAAFLHPSHAC